MAHIAFIGLGNMGSPMSANLIRAGHTVTGFDQSADRLDAFSHIGGQGADSIRAAVRGADHVITMLPTGRHVREVYEGADGLIAAASPGALFIDSSTIDIESAKAVANAAAAAGFSMLDAPVSGAVPAAEGARLTFMVGGAAADFERAAPILKAMGTNVFHVGDNGAGQALKICNNMMAGISMAGISEVFALAGRLGLEPRTVYDVMIRSSGNCWALEAYCPVPGPLPSSPANRDYAPGFTARMMLKDMRLSQQAAGLAGAATPLAGVAAALYQMVVANGDGELDFSCIFKLIDKG